MLHPANTTIALNHVHLYYIALQVLHCADRWSLVNYSFKILFLGLWVFKPKCKNVGQAIISTRCRARLVDKHSREFALLRLLGLMRECRLLHCR